MTPEYNVLIASAQERAHVISLLFIYAVSALLLYVMIQRGPLPWAEKLRPLLSSLYWPWLVITYVLASCLALIL